MYSSGRKGSSIGMMKQFLPGVPFFTEGSEPSNDATAKEEAAPAGTSMISFSPSSRVTDDFTSDDDEERWQLITDDFNTTIPITKIRVLNRKAIKSNYCCISFSTLPAKKVDCNKFFINFWTLTIGDNISNSISWGVPISNCVHRGGNWYEFEFSRPVYFAYYQDFCPRGQVKAYK